MKTNLNYDINLAIVMKHPQYAYHREWQEGTLKDGNLTAFCAIKRKDGEEQIQSFSFKQAERAKLFGSNLAWDQSPDRMIQIKARNLALIDQFSDALSEGEL